MPVIKSAKKKLRQDKKRQLQNKGVKNALKAVIKAAKLTMTPEAISKAFQAADKATKLHIIHKNKAARLKSTLSKLDASKKPVTTEKKTVKKATKKTPATKKK